MASKPAGPLSIEEIEAIIPHRYPFLLVDRVLEVTETKVKAVKNVTGNEPFFQGHFPGFKIMPGVLIIEAMAQAAAVMQLRQPGREGWYVLFAGIDKARFKRPVRPGDTLIIEAELTKMRGPIGMGHGRATVDGELAAECEIKFALQPPSAENAK